MGENRAPLRRLALSVQELEILENLEKREKNIALFYVSNYSSS